MSEDTRSTPTTDYSSEELQRKTRAEELWNRLTDDKVNPTIGDIEASIAREVAQGGDPIELFAAFAERARAERHSSEYRGALLGAVSSIVVLFAAFKETQRYFDFQHTAPAPVNPVVAPAPTSEYVNDLLRSLGNPSATPSATSTPPASTEPANVPPKDESQGLTSDYSFPGLTAVAGAPTPSADQGQSTESSFASFPSSGNE